MEKKRRTEIAELGEFGLIDLLTRGFDSADASTLRAAGDDAAIVMPPSGEAVLCSTDALLEGIDFDLTYFPLRHLGYKAVTVAASDILAMNALPSQLMVSLGVSSKLSVEALQELYEGIAFACREQGIDLVGGDTKASMTGLVLGLTALGHAPKEKVVSRGGAQQNDLICISGNLGAAYMGLRLLEREKRVLADVKDPEPKFAGYEYLLEKYLKPRLRKDIVEALAEEGIVPTSMIDLSDGLSSDLMQICKASKCGARIYLDRIPIARQTYALAEEMNADPVVAALNGGEDHELLFTVPLAFTGGLLGMLVTGQQLTMISLMGFIVLMGTVVNNGIVFVDYANQLRLGGMERRAALIATGKTRMRPILMTTLTTVLAMLQLVFSNDMASQLMSGMAIVIICGLSYATLMTLYIVPILYDILFKKPPLVVDVGDDGMDDIPDDAAEYIAQSNAAEAQPEA